MRWFITLYYLYQANNKTETEICVLQWFKYRKTGMFNFYLQSRRSYVIQSGHCVSVSRPVALQQHILAYSLNQLVRLLLKCDGTRAETRFRLSAKRTSPFKSAGRPSVQSTTGSRSMCISSSNARYTMFRGSVKSTGYPLHSPVHLNLPVGVSSVDYWQPRCAHQR